MDDKLAKQKFIEMRANELSLDKISKEIKISKPTLIKWSRELQNEIHNHKSLIIDNLKEEFHFSRIKNLQTLNNTYLCLEKELLARDFSDLSSDKLFSLYTTIKTQLENNLTTTHKVEERFTFDDLEKTVNSWII